MNPSATLFIFTCLTILHITCGQEERSPHGLAYQHPMAFSPSAFEFFHPKTQQQQPSTSHDPCGDISCAPFPLAAQVESSQGHESKMTTSKTITRRVGAGAIASIVFGFVVVLGMGVYYVVSTRRENIGRTNSVQPDV